MALKHVLVAMAAAYAVSADVSATTADLTVDSTVKTSSTGSGEKFEFQAEVSRLMDIVINSLYQKKEIFLRELISNASDALDKLRFLAVGDDKALADNKDLEIRVSFDKDAQTLTIRDTGVGMTKNELVNNLGTVARSGTAAFMEQMSSGGDLSLIGQFGVGFYSAYLVAERVRVVSKNVADDQWVWESTADGTFVVEKDTTGPSLGRGTEITLFLKDDATEYTTYDAVSKLIKRYSEFITFPIYLQNVKTETVEASSTSEDADASSEPKEIKSAEDEAAEEMKKETAEEDEVVAAEEDSSKEKPKKTETRTVKTWDLQNDQKAIWQRKTRDVADEEYSSFYKRVAKDDFSGKDPITWTHFSAEGEVEFRSILYVPSQAPSDIYDNYYAKSNALRLYVRKVLISDEFEDLIPRYLSFVRGVVDSDDLPLNVSRETLQQHKILKVMGKKLVRKVLEMLRKLAQDEERAVEEAKKAAAGEDAEKSDKEDKAKAETSEDDEDDEEGSSSDKKEPLREGAATAYCRFWQSFGKSIKLGIIEDGSNRSKLAKLLRFKSNKSIAAEKERVAKEDVGIWRSLEQYVADMKAGQKFIYYIAGESVDAVSASPFLERLQAKNLEVIYFTDPIDEYALQQLPEFDGHRLQSITKEGLQLPGDDAETEKRREQLYLETYKPLTEYLKKVYGDKVEKITVSRRLANTPCVLVTSQFGYSANMERIMRNQAFSDTTKQAFMLSKKTMEINPRHPIIDELKTRAVADPEAKEEQTRDLAKLLFDTALLNSGFVLEDPTDFATRMYRLMKTGLSLESLELKPEIDMPAAPADEEEDEEEETEEETKDEL